MVITMCSGTQALIYELALIPFIFGLDWVGLDSWVDGFDWIGSAKMDPCPTLAYLRAPLQLIE